MSETFLQLCLRGEALMAEVDDYVAKWHQSRGAGSISEFLGFTQDEYALWVERPEILRHIIYARRNGVSLEEAISASKTVAARARSRGRTKARRNRPNKAANHAEQKLRAL